MSRGDITIDSCACDGWSSGTSVRVRSGSLTGQRHEVMWLLAIMLMTGEMLECRNDVRGTWRDVMMWWEYMRNRTCDESGVDVAECWVTRQGHSVALEQSRAMWHDIRRSCEWSLVVLRVGMNCQKGMVALKVMLAMLREDWYRSMALVPTSRWSTCYMLILGDKGVMYMCNLVRHMCRMDPLYVMSNLS